MSRVTLTRRELESLLRQRQARAGAPVQGDIRFVVGPAREGAPPELLRVEYDVLVERQGWGG